MSVPSSFHPGPWLFQRILWSAVTALMVVGLPAAMLVVGLGWAV